MLAKLVGRTAELDVLLAAATAAGAGSAQAVVLSGDAGVGKTRLLAELADRVRPATVRILVGHCIDFGDAGVAYLPFSELFGRLVQDAADPAGTLFARYEVLQRLLPHRRGEAAVDEPIERAALFESVLGALTELGADQPVLLIIEDAHWADKATRDLLGFLLARLDGQRLAVVVSYRSDDVGRRHPLRPAVANWTRLPAVHRLHLLPLLDDEMRTLVRQLQPRPLAEQELRALVDRAGGNPFFAEQLVANLDTTCSVPFDLADVLLVRLDSLTDPARTVVRAAAVAGRRVSHELLAQVVELPDQILDTAVRESVDAHLLTAQADGRYGFRHALLAEAIYDDLLPGERIRLHARYAEALAGTRGTAAELARHARGSHDLATAYQASVQAAGDAMGLAAPWDAMRHYETALELQGSAPQDQRRGAPPVDLLRRAADAMTAAGHPHRAVDLLRRARGELPTDSPPETTARLLASLATAALSTEAEPLAFEASAQALQLVPAEPPTALRARVAALHARAALAFGRSSDARRWAEEAAAVAALTGAGDVEADAATTLAALQRRAGDPDAVTRALGESIEVAVRAGDLATELRGRYVLAALRFEQGDLTAALGDYRRNVERSVARGRPWTPYGLESRMNAALLEYLVGDWDRSLQTSSTADQPPSPMAEALLGAVRLWVLVGRGDKEAFDLLPLLRGWMHRDSMVAVQLSAAVDLLGWAGRPEQALTLRDELVDVLAGAWQDAFFPGQIRLSAMTIGTLADHVPGRPHDQQVDWVRRAGELADVGRAAAQRLGDTAGVEARAWLLRLDAELHRLRWLAGEPSDLDAVTSAWQDAVDGAGFAHAYMRARARARLAAVLRATGRLADAQREADLARAVARRLRAVPLLEELKHLAVRPTPTRTAASGLTAREHEVLQLLEEGRSNREVAGRLFISEKTVSVHVSNILAKLNARSRSEAAAIARREGLLTGR